MINEYNVKRFCNDYHLIENYEIAVNDSQMWDCHHRNEIIENKSRQQLKDEGRYYDVSPDELIFLTRSEHLSLHHKGKTNSEDTRKKISEKRKDRGGLPKKQVQCIETGEVFNSLHSAARHYNLLCSSICECCNGKRKSCGGFHWKFI